MPASPTKVLLTVEEAAAQLTIGRTTLYALIRTGVTTQGKTAREASDANAKTMNAVMDALAPIGVTHLDMPASPHRVWKAIRAARA